MEYYMYSTNSADLSCTDTNSATAPDAPAPASPMEVDNLDSLELEEITLVGGRDDHLLEGGRQEDMRDRGQNRGDGRRHRDREDYNSRHGQGPRHYPRRN